MPITWVTGMPKLESCLKIKVDSPTQAQRLTPPWGRKPRKASKHTLTPEDARQIIEEAKDG